MTTSNWGKTLLIVNPTSQVGKGQVAGELASKLLTEALPEGTFFVQLTEGPDHAESIAAEGGYDTVIALGGDGVIHEVANGIMRLPAEERPRFGIIPVGSGNDYARTLGISEDVETAVKQLLSATERTLDVGLCNNEYFVETLSFGLDAAIAIETTELRKHTDKTGNALYFKAGVDQLTHNRVARHYAVSFDGEPVQTGSALTLAVQNGRTYGGGFIICPKADPTDGTFDICVASGEFSLVKALALFSKAKDGKHVGHPQIAMRRAKGLEIEFTEEVPAQMDGEDCTGIRFSVSIIPAALRVLCAE